MLRPEVTIDDIICIMFIFINCVSIYAGYRWGHSDGYSEGCRARRKANRQIRRLMR